MNTIALWYDPGNNSAESSKEESVELEVHINFWNIKKRWEYIHLLPWVNRMDYVLDLGFKINNINNLSRLNIFFPSERIKENNIEDVGGILLRNNDLINLIFNEQYQIHDANIPKQKSVQDKDGKTLFNIREIDFKSKGDFTLNQKYGGTVLSLNIDSTNDTECKNRYIRIRLINFDIKTFARIHNPRNWFFQSAFKTVETIDFRINEKRNYDSSLAEEIISKREFNIQKIHFLLMRNATDDFISPHVSFTCRELETNLWGHYFSKKYNLKNIIAYHWSEKPDANEKEKGIECFNTLVKLKVYKSNLKTIILYILVVGLLSVPFSIISNVISDTKEFHKIISDFLSFLNGLK
jgi:hypothetical protein